MDKTIDRWTDPDGNGYAFKDTVARAQNRELINKISTETADRKTEVNTERKRIDNLIKELPATAGEYQQSKLVLHSYDNTAVKCTTTSGNYTNVPAFTTDQGGPLSSLYTKKSNYQIAVNKSGLYLFELRIHVNSLIANKRVELAPFVNDTRNAALASSYNTAGDFTLTQVAALPLWLSANDTVDFRIAPIEAAKVSLQLGDVLVYAIDWEDKFKIPDYTGYAAETKDIRTGADGTVYGTAGEAVRKQIGNLTEDLDNRSELVELNAKGQENKVWYQKGVKKTDAGWKCVEYDVTNVSKIYVTGIGKLYRDFVTGFKNGVYVKSLYQENQQETYTDYECDVSNCDTIFALQFVNTDPLSVKIKSIKTDIYTISELTKEITYRSVMNGYYSKTKLVDSVGDKIYIYDIRDYQKINVIGTIRQYRNLYTLFDSSMNPVDYGIQLVADGKADFELDTTNYAYIGIDSNTGSTNWTVLGKLNFRNFAKNENTKIYKSWIPMKWVRTEQYTYQRNKQYAPANMVSNVFDVSELNTVRIKAKSSAYVNYYTLLKDGEVIDYNFNDSSNNLVEIDNIVDTSRGDTLLVTVDHGHEARQGIAYVEKEIYVNNLYGKTIGWWGTSIPAFGAEGYNHPESYPNIIGGLLGANVVNHAVGESCVHCKDYTLISDSNPYGFVEDFRNVSRCLTNTIEEMQWIIDNFNSGVFTKNVPNSLSDDDKSLILGCSYENRLIPYLDSTDIFVFDHGHNDKADAGNHSYDTTKDIYGEKNLYSYVGAMNWIMNLIKTNNPRAVVIQISEYDYNTNKYGVLKQQKFVDVWGIPFMELYKLTGWTSPITIKTTGYWGTDGYWVSSGGSGQNLTIRQMFLKDDLHPYTDRSNKTAWYLAELIANWMKNTI